MLFDFEQTQRASWAVKVCQGALWVCLKSKSILNYTKFDDIILERNHLLVEYRIKNIILKNPRVSG